MNFHLKKAYLFFLIIFAIIFASCSNSLTEVSNASLTVIYEYQNSTNYPTARLTVFVSPSENVRRVESLKVSSLENNYEWETYDVLQIQNNSKYYAGYTNFVMPEGSKFPQGDFEIYYTEADDDESSCFAKLNYNEEFYKLNAEDALQVLKNQYFVEKIAIYDINSTLIFFGNYEKDIKTTDGLLKKYKSAYSIKKIWTAQDDSVFCIFPLEKLINNEN